MNILSLHILKEVKRGNEKYYSKLMELYNPMLKRLANFYLNSSYNKYADIDDSIQEVWIKVFKYIEILDDLTKFPSWLSKIMKNYCINLQKRNTDFIKKHIVINLENRHDLIEKIEDENINNINISDRTAMMSVLNELPEVYSEILKMHYFSGFRIKDIAFTQGISESLVKWRLVKAREMLKKKTKNKIKNDGR